MDLAIRFDLHGASDSLAVSTTSASVIGAAHMQVCRSDHGPQGSLLLAQVGFHAASAIRHPPLANPTVKSITVKSQSAKTHRPWGVNFQLPQRVNFQFSLTANHLPSPDAGKRHRPS